LRHICLERKIIIKSPTLSSVTSVWSRRRNWATQVDNLERPPKQKETREMHIVFRSTLCSSLFAIKLPKPVNPASLEPWKEEKNNFPRRNQLLSQP
jgi:hypothetical protein